jgi:hypothetical protein
LDMVDFPISGWTVDQHIFIFITVLTRKIPCALQPKSYKKLCCTKENVQYAWNMDFSLRICKIQLDK